MNKEELSISLNKINELKVKNAISDDEFHKIRSSIILDTLDKIEFKNDEIINPIDSKKPLKGVASGILLTLFLPIIGFILCLILGDKWCKKSATITFFVIIKAIYSYIISFLLIYESAIILAATISLSGGM